MEAKGSPRVIEGASLQARMKRDILIETSPRLKAQKISEGFKQAEVKPSPIKPITDEGVSYAEHMRDVGKRQRKTQPSPLTLRSIEPVDVEEAEAKIAPLKALLSPEPIEPKTAPILEELQKPPIGLKLELKSPAPELKLPEVSVPTFFPDAYYQLIKDKTEGSKLSLKEGKGKKTKLMEGKEFYIRDPAGLIGSKQKDRFYGVLDLPKVLGEGNIGIRDELVASGQGGHKGHKSLKSSRFEDLLMGGKIELYDKAGMLERAGIGFGVVEEEEEEEA